MGHPHQNDQPAIYGRYQTLFRIAAGGMAEVYAARVRGEAGFQKLVALKRMLPHLTDDERFVTMFMDEGKLAANISSPNVVSTLDLGRADDGSLFLVMELVVGTTLSGLLRNAAKDGSSVPVDVGVEMLAQAAQGLHDAHEAKTPFGAPLGIVHRDISPQNILVGVDGRVRITDFGVARAVMRRTKTSTGEFKGKLSYFSPEQCADKHLDRRSDVFSLGVVAWETLTTKRLFHAENPLAVLERVTRMIIPSAHAVRADVPEAVAKVVAGALERDRDQRFNSAIEFGQALRAAARGTCGVTGRHEVSSLVKKCGGESFERVQRQLKQSLANNGALGHESAAEDGEKTEISSGIIFAPGRDGPLPIGSSTPKAGAAPPPPPPARNVASRFVEDPHARPVDEEESATGKIAMAVAIVVAILGLGAGATIGVIAATSPESEVEALPTAPLAAEAADPEGAEGQGSVFEPVLPEAPPSAEPETPEEEPTAAAPEAPPASHTSRRGSRRRARRRAPVDPQPHPLGSTPIGQGARTGRRSPPAEETPTYGGRNRSRGIIMEL